MPPIVKSPANGPEGADTEGVKVTVTGKDAPAPIIAPSPVHVTVPTFGVSVYVMCRGWVGC